jgi:hypothetical protein
MFTKKDSLVDAVTKVMQENQTRREVERQVNETFGIYSRNALPNADRVEYDRVLAEKTAQALNEELKGNQSKIDANKNGKVDGQDFKLLRAKKGQMEEEKADKDYDGDGKIESSKSEVMGSRMKAAKAAGNMEESEQIDELSRGTMSSYARKADSQLQKVDANGPSHKAGIPSHYRGKNKELGKDPADKMKARKAGIKLAIKKLNKEEVQVDEGIDPRDSRREFERPNNSLNTAWDRLATRLPYDTKRSKKSNAGQQSGLKHSIKSAMGKHGPKGHLPEEVQVEEDWEAGSAPKGSNARKRKAVQMALGRKHKGDEDFNDRMNPKTAALIHGRKLQKKGVNEEQIDEKAPPGDKYERMVKHIKSKYSKGGLSDKEKSIAYATAWKAKNKESK